MGQGKAVCWKGSKKINSFSKQAILLFLCRLISISFGLGLPSKYMRVVDLSELCGISDPGARVLVELKFFRGSQTLSVGSLLNDGQRLYRINNTNVPKHKFMATLKDTFLFPRHAVSWNIGQRAVQDIVWFTYLYFPFIFDQSLRSRLLLGISSIQFVLLREPNQVCLRCSNFALHSQLTVYSPASPRFGERAHQTSTGSNFRFVKGNEFFATRRRSRSTAFGKRSPKEKGGTVSVRLRLWL